MIKQFFTLSLLLFIVQFSQAQNIQLLSNLPYNTDLSSCWGYYDAINQKEYAIVGTYSGTSIVDITNPTTPTQVAFLGGSASSWREMKVWSHYAYIVHDVSNGSNEGMQIIDLQYLPDSVKTYNIKNFTSNGKNINIQMAHTVFIDEDGILYLNGGRSTTVNGVGISGTIMFDISQNPTQPEYLGHQNAKYVHDSYARDNYLYESEVYAGTQSIYDISDKANPILVSTTTTPYAYNHNSWTSDDGNYLFTTDEREYAPIGVYDIHDKSNPILISTIKNSPNESVIPHNVRVINDYLVVAHYKLGVVIWDASHPDNIIKVGQYDCSPNYDNIASPWHGVWEAYPYFPSGNIILSDIDEGLFVVKPNYIRAARLEGTVYDAITNQVLPSAVITFLDDASINSTSNAIGEYKTGRVENGIFNVSIDLAGYISQTATVSIQNDSVTILNIHLTPRGGKIEGNIKDINTNLDLQGATIAITELSKNYTTDSLGYFITNTIDSGVYNIHVALAGYISIDTTVTIYNGVITLQDFYLQPIATNKIENAVQKIKIAVQNKQVILINNQADLYTTCFISDVLGRKYNYTLSNNILDLSALSNGTYFLTFVLNDKTLYSQQFYLH
ncbi:MAG: choice-of-anchor B family protein [Chitinophagales bacterium]|nr:choice-of-anchor B family protein [Chitinophagales bacterium]